MTDSRFQSDEWKIIETRFEPERGRDSESIFALGNGMMGQRANFEERYSGDTLQGTYVAGIYYPDKTVVGWWKNGYPEYFAKVPNAPSWTGIDVKIDGEQRTLQMQSESVPQSAGYEGRVADAVVHRSHAVRQDGRGYRPAFPFHE
jgi:maltose phosphorylase